MPKSFLSLAILLSGLGQAAFASSPHASAADPSPTPSSVVISTATVSDLGGDYLTDQAGKSLYVFELDSPGQSKCTDAQCAAIWPPLVSPSFTSPTATGNAKQSLVGVPIQRPDGKIQCIYGPYPLYYFKGDLLPGDRKGQCLNSFGGIWHLVKPDGTPYSCSSTPSPSSTAPPVPYAPPPTYGGPSGGSCGTHDVCGWTLGWRCYDPQPYLSQCRPECCRYTGDSSCTGSNYCGGGGSSSSNNSCGPYTACGWTPGWHCYSNSNSSPPVGYRPECCYNAGDSSCRGYG